MSSFKSVQSSRVLHSARSTQDLGFGNYFSARPVSVKCEYPGRDDAMYSHDILHTSPPAAAAVESTPIGARLLSFYAAVRGSRTAEICFLTPGCHLPLQPQWSEPWVQWIDTTCRATEVNGAMQSPHNRAIVARRRPDCGNIKCMWVCMDRACGAQAGYKLQQLCISCKLMQTSLLRGDTGQ